MCTRKLSGRNGIELCKAAVVLSLDRSSYGGLIHIYIYIYIDMLHGPGADSKAMTEAGSCLRQFCTEAQHSFSRRSV